MLSDNNADLIACYRAVRDCPEQVIGELSRLASGHARDGARHYYEVRNERFNPQRAALAAAPDRGFEYTPSLAAMFVYLNRTGYNGLFRLNSDGEFNVPAGSYAKPKICDEPNLRRVAKALARPGLTLERARFERVVERAGAGDFLYFDPPYAPLSKTARFTSYTAEGFDADDQKRLRDLARHARPPWLPGADEQLHGARDRGTLRRQRGRRLSRVAMLPNTGAPRHQLEPAAPRNSRRIRHHERSRPVESASLRFAHSHVLERPAGRCNVPSVSRAHRGRRARCDRRSCRVRPPDFFAGPSRRRASSPCPR